MTLLLASVLVLALALPLQAVWTNDPFNGMIYVCCARDQQSWVRSCKLQGDRTLVAWGDLRGTQSMIHYQVLDGAGNPLLAANGVPIVDGTWNAYWHSAENSIMPDGEGGAIAVFRDSRQSNQLIYGQRFDSLGNRLWGPRGLPLVIWPEPDVALLEVTYDALGNYFIILGRITDLYAQKFDRNGQRFWGETGVPVCIASGYQDDPKPVPDGQGGIIVVWNDQRTGAGNGWLYFQNLNAGGVAQCGVSGRQVFDAAGRAQRVMWFEGGVSDGQGGGVWFYCTPNPDHNVLCLLNLNSNGEPIWSWNHWGAGHIPAVLRSATDGCYWISAQDNRSGEFRWYLYRFSASGEPLFGNDGLPFGGYTMLEVNDGMIIAGNVSWGYRGYTRVYALRVNASGDLAWRSDVAIGHMYYECPAFWGPVVSSDNADGAVLAFEDYRRLPIDSCDISAQRVNADGSLGVTTRTPEPVQVALQCNSSSARISLVLPAANSVQIELFDLLGRIVHTQNQLPQNVWLSAGQHEFQLGGLGLPSGVYLYRLQAGDQASAGKVLIQK